MIKKVFLFIAVMLTWVGIYANPVDSGRALEVAKTFWQKQAGVVETPRFLECGAELGLDGVYIFNLADGDGFVIVSGDDIAQPILGFSTETGFSASQLPDHIRGWLEHYIEEIKVANRMGMVQSLKVQNAWAELEGQVTPAPKAPGAKVVNQLMHTQWNQSSPYNDQCPVDTGGRAVSGCVATAMAQIMRYWAWPPTGTGSHSYTCSTLYEPRTLSVDFSAATYDWDNMPAGGRGIYFWSDEEKAAVAQLVYHCGVAVNMGYTRKESGAGMGYVATALRDYFSYTSNIRIVSRSSYSDADWIALMKHELDSIRPVNYSGSSSDGSGGHSFIVDGYNDDDYFHINWGWGGYCDGWYELSNLVTGSGGIGGGSYDFSYRQGAIIGIESPSLEPATIVVEPLSLAVNDTFSVSDTVAYGEYIRGFCAIRNFGDDEFVGHYGVGAYRNDTLISVLKDVESSLQPMYYNYFSINTRATNPLLPGDYVVKAIKSADGVNWETIDLAYDCESSLPLHIYAGEYYGATLVTYDTFALVSDTVTYDTYIRGLCRIHNYSDDAYTAHYGIGAYRNDTLISVMHDYTDAISSGGDKYLYISTRATAPLIPGDYLVKPIMSADGSNWQPITLTHGNIQSSLPLNIQPSEFYGESLVVYDTFSVADTVTYGEYITGICCLRNVGEAAYTGYYGVAAFRNDTLVGVLKEYSGTINVGYRTYIYINKKAVNPLSPGDYSVKPVKSDDGETWQVITRAYEGLATALPLHIDSSEYDGVSSFAMKVYSTFEVAESTAYGDVITGSAYVLNADESPFEGFLGVGAYRNGERVALLSIKSTTLRSRVYTPITISALAIGALTPGDYTAKIIYGQDGVNWREVTVAYNGEPTSVDFTITASGEVDTPVVSLCVYSDLTISSPTARDSNISGQCCILNRSIDTYNGYLGIGAYNGEDFVKMMSCGTYSFDRNYYRCTYPSLTAQDPLTPGIYTAKAMYSLDGINWTPITTGCYTSSVVEVDFNITENGMFDQTQLALFNSFTVSPSVEYESNIEGACTITNMGGATWHGYTGVAAYQGNTFVTMLAQTQDSVPNMSPITIAISKSATSPLLPGVYTAKAVYSADGANWTVIGESANGCPTEVEFTITKYNLQTTAPFSIASATPYGGTLTGNCAIVNSGNGRFAGHLAVAAYQGSTRVAMLAQEEGTLDISMSQSLYVNYPTVATLTPGNYTTKALYSADGTNWTAITTSAVGGATEVPFTISEALPTNGDTSASACTSFTWALNDATYTESGVYFDTIPHGNHLGGDSIVTLNLTINEKPTVTIDGPTDIYTGRTAALTAQGALSYVWNTGLEGAVLTVTPSVTTTYSVVGRDINGCEDSASHTINVTGPPATHSDILDTACDSFLWTLNGETYTESGSYDYTITGGNHIGGDSIITLHLVVNTSPVILVTGDTNVYLGHSTTLTASGAMSYVWSLGGNEVSHSNPYTIDSITDEVTYTVVGTSVNRCTGSASVTVHPMPIPTTYGDTTAVACDSFTWLRNSATYTENGTHEYTIPGGNYLGGDSVITLNLTINHSSTASLTVDTCELYEWNSTVYTSDTTAVFVTTNAAGCDSTVTLHLTVNHASFGIETVEACESYVWHGNTYTANNNSATFVTTNAAGCDSTVTLHLTISLPDTTFVTDSVHSGQPYSGYGFSVSSVQTHAAQPGDIITLSESYATSAVCDSVVILNLYVMEPLPVPVYYSDTTASVCDSFTWYGTTYTESAEPEHLLTASDGFDSIVTLHLTVRHSTYAVDSDTACDSYVWTRGDGMTYTATTNEPVFVTENAAGCDSTVTLNLIVNYSTRSIARVDTCDSYVWMGVTYTSDTTAVRMYTNAAGCDSTATLQLTVRRSTAGSLDVEACESYVWHRITYTSDATATYTAVNEAGCDSVITLYLTISMPDTTFVTDSVHSGQPYSGYGFNVPASQTRAAQPGGIITLTESYATTAVCDSVVNLSLYVMEPLPVPVYYSDTVASVCDSFTWYGTTYTESAEPEHLLIATDGGDSIVTLHLTILHSTTATVTAESCESYLWYGTTYTESTTETHVTTNAFGCDSTITLHLTVNYASMAVDTQEVCDSYVWIDGQTYTLSTDEPSVVLTGADLHGCDSVITLHLTVNHSSVSHFNDLVTLGESYSGYGFNLPAFDSAGVYDYTQTVLSVAGCDSTVTLHLTVVDDNPAIDSSALQLVSFIVEPETPYGSDIIGSCTITPTASAPITAHVAVGAYSDGNLVCFLAEETVSDAEFISLNINYPATEPLTVGTYTAKVLVQSTDGVWMQIVNAAEGCPIETEFSIIDNNSITDNPSAESRLVVFAKGLTLVVKGCEGRGLEVTDLMGRRHYRALPSSDVISIPLPAAGVYFVKADGSKAVKVVVR
ncbi:MAG: C10 family peptidase [Bacteroidales bacterium]|nr:C10 family peptidase [Bacteroidales bacterium]